MSNTHTVPDFASELQATCEDLLPACVISTSWPTVPASSLTLAAFTTQGYVKDLQNLIYVDQPAITLTLPSANGTNWLALTRDVSTAYSGWTRRAGSHYMFQLAGSRPPDVDGLLVFASAVVAGVVITAVTPAPGVTRAERWRTLAGLGTMAPQNASAVAITGGSAELTGNLSTTGTAAVGGAPVGSNVALNINYQKASRNGISMTTTDSDTGAFANLQFRNLAGSTVGTITTTGSATGYNTTSDVRLKHAIAALAGALGVVTALRPVSFLWNADGSQGHGFLAHELMQVVPEAVTGEPSAVDAQGNVLPQQVDHSRLVPWLTAACQELVQQVQALQARVHALEEALGL